jgi:hypothetical protein
MGHKRFQLNPAKFQSLWQTCDGKMASWSPGNAPAKFAAHFATEGDRPHKQQNGHIEIFCSLVSILPVSVAEQHDCVHEPGAALWLKA